jgi:hypothetical protein
MASEPKKMPWFLTSMAVFAAIIFAGPFAIPLVWMSGAFKRWQKWAITAALVLLSAWIFKASSGLYDIMSKEMRELQEIMK